MINKVISIIREEDKKNPLKDEQISRMLGISREKVNTLRQEAGIPKYLERREEVLLEAINNIIDINSKTSVRKLVIELNKKGFEISTYGLKKYKEHIESRKKIEVSCEKSPEIKRKVSNTNNIKAFSNLIGEDGSLRQVIKLAKAAILYPPNGLHTLIIGNTGVGKSQLVEQMHLFAKEIRKDKNIPFIVFNCADYSDNPQLLVAQLFGYSKGSFTGANTDKAGLVERANGGILFLDEIHRLPPKGQEILFRIIDKGEYARLGETSRTRKVNLMIIGATTENVESNLLITFRRRIPVLIEIPVIEDRPITERLELIKKFFTKEAERINSEIEISEDIMETLIFYDCPGNIGQLKSDIQVICAKAFVNFLSNKGEKIKITINDLPKRMKKQMLDIANERKFGNTLNIPKLNIIPNSISENGINDEMIRNNIYQFIEKRMKILKDKEKSWETKKNLIEELNNIIEDYTLNIENKYLGISLKDIKNLLDKEIVDIIDDLVEMILSEISIKDTSLFNVFCLHISLAIERIKSGNPIVNSQLENIKKNYRKEFEVSLRVARFLEERLELRFPEDEVGFIALYLNNFSNKTKISNSSKVGLLVITHGEAAKAMLETAQAIVGANHGTAVSMNLDDNPEKILEEVKELAAKEDKGKGVLFLVDMGFLVRLGEIISEQIGVPIKTISRVDTLMIMEAVSQASLSFSTLETVYNSIIELDKNAFNCKLSDLQTTND
jgi:transcriptional regulator with AAA-type ATPase domain